MKIDPREFQAALDGIKKITEEGIARDRDFTKVLTTAAGSNFTLMLIPSKEAKYVNAVDAIMNGAAA